MDIRKDIVVLDGLVGNAGWLMHKQRVDGYVIFHKKPTDKKGRIFAELEVYIDFFDNIPSVFIDINHYCGKEESDKLLKLVEAGDSGFYDCNWFAVNFSLGDPDCAEKLQTGINKIMEHWKEEYGFRA
jgi:hypothetical protein